MDLLSSNQKVEIQELYNWRRGRGGGGGGEMIEMSFWEF